MKTIIFILLSLSTSLCYAKDYEKEITEAAMTVGLDPKLLSSLCYLESKHNPNAINRDDGNGDSIGMCQIKVATAKQFDKKATAKKLFNVEYNLKIAAQYLAYQIDRYDGNLRKAVLAYNAGSYIERKKSKKQGLAVNESYFTKIMKIRELFTSNDGFTLVKTQEDM